MTRLSEHEFRQKLFKKHSDDIILAGSYTNTKTKTLFYHKFYGKRVITPGSALSGEHRPKEIGRLLTREQFIKKLFNKYNDTITLIGEYVNTQTKTLFFHKLYGERVITPNAALGGKSHSKKGQRKKLTEEQFKVKLKLKHGDNIILIGKYKLSNIKTTFMHIIYGEWEAKPNAILNGYSHPNGKIHRMMKSRAINGTDRCSLTEKKLLEFSLTLSNDFKKTSFISNNGGSFEYDMVSASKKIAIELNGEYWHSTDRKGTNHHHKTHYIKSRVAEDNGYTLIHIWESEWNNNENLVKSYISSRLGVYERKIGASKCKLIEIFDKTLVKNFLLKNHLKGCVNWKKCYGLFYKNELITLSTFNIHHRNNKEMILNRFCTLKGVQNYGSLSRLSTHAANNLNCDIYSFQEIRLGCTNTYINSGWKFVNKSSPDYFYFNGDKIISKQTRKKNNVNTPNGMTEHEHALLDGLIRVYDCGKIKLIFSKNT